MKPRIRRQEGLDGGKRREEEGRLVGGEGIRKVGWCWERREGWRKKGNTEEGKERRREKEEGDVEGNEGAGRMEVRREKNEGGREGLGE